VTHTDWLPGILVLLLGLAASAAVLLFLRRRAPPAGKHARRAVAAKDVEEAELRWARLLEQLRELEADRHHLSPEAYQAENARLEHLAADALRARDEARPGVSKAEPPASPAPPRFSGRHPQLAGAFWGAGVVVFFGALFLWLKQDVQPRTQGGGLTGTVGRGEMASEQPPEAEDPAFATALARVRDDPGDVETSAHVVHELIRRQDYDEARLLTERSLGIDPFLSEARIHRAFLLAVGGDPKAASSELEHLSSLYPNSSEALLFLGLLRMRAGDNPGAADAFQRFLAEAPSDEQPPEMRAALLKLLQQLKSQR
jgi:TolA-binding protein